MSYTDQQHFNEAFWMKYIEDKYFIDNTLMAHYEHGMDFRPVHICLCLTSNKFDVRLSSSTLTIHRADLM